MKDRIRTTVGFVEGRQGLLFQIRSEPTVLANRGNLRTVLLIPPLAEELNRSRRFLTLLRLAVAERGGTFILLDLFGTGDSDGDFVDARWATWCGDTQDSLSRLNRESDVSLVGLRSGCLVASDVQRRANCNGLRLVHIQPELKGTAVLKRWLRARVAAGRFSGSRIESTADLLMRLEAGESLNLGGYVVHPDLTKALQESTVMAGELLDDDGTGPRNDIIMLNDLAEFSGLSNDAERVLGIPRLRVNSVPIRPFWQLQEHEPEPGAIARIAEILLP